MDKNRVIELTDASTGQWLVETSSGSRHVFDFEASTYRRLRSDGGVKLGTEFDEGAVHRLVDIDQWPRLNSVFRIWVREGASDVTVDSSYVARISPLTDTSSLDHAAGQMTTLESVSGAPPTNAWLLVGDDEAYPTDQELRAQRDLVDPLEVDWTCPRQILRGDLVFLYFMAPRKAIHFVSRALFPPVYDPDVQVNAKRVVDSHQWWTDLAPLVEVTPVPFAQLRDLFDGHLVLKGKPTHYLTPSIVEHLIAGFGELNAEQSLVLQLPVGDPELPDPARMTLDDLRRVSSGQLKLEAMVEQYIVDPLLRLCFGPVAGASVVRQHAIPGAGVVDYAVRGTGGLLGVVEVKLGVQHRRNGGLLGSPDLAQVLRYSHSACVPALLIDSNEIILIDSGATDPRAVIDRRHLAVEHLDKIRTHFCEPTGR